MQHWDMADQPGSLDKGQKVDSTVWSSYPYSGQAVPFGGVTQSWSPTIPDEVNYGALTAGNHTQDQQFFSSTQSVYHGDSQAAIGQPFSQSSHQGVVDPVFESLNSHIYGSENLDF